MERAINIQQKELDSRQAQFGALMGILPEKLKGLTFCSTCGGADYEWTDWSCSELDTDGVDIRNMEQAIEYRNYLASNRCQSCDGTGFQGGSFDLTKEQWIELGKLANTR